MRISLFLVGILLLVWAVRRHDVSQAVAVPVSGTVIWKAGDPNFGHWVVATAYQCGTPVNTGPTFTFTLVLNGSTCGRNQANPLRDADPADLVYLQDGGTFVWDFDYIDGTPSGAAPGMGADTDARSLIWQIHGQHELRTPCFRLMFINGADEVSRPQMWGLSDCSGIVWAGPYTPGERDHFRIVAKISSGPTGFVEIYRNGAFQARHAGANYHNSRGDPWWNFGPYKWRWELAGGGGSTMTQVNATIDNMVLTKL
jgi:hypothetical protein